MPFVAVGATGLVSAVVGAILVGLLADQCVRWYGISSVEGESGYFVVLLALLGAVAGFVIGAASGWRATKRGGGLLSGLGKALAIDVGLVALATGLAYAAADHAPEVDGRGFVIEVELLTPEGPLPLDDSGFWPSMAIMALDGETSSYAVFEYDTALPSDGRWLIATELPLNTSVAQKRVYVKWSETEALYFPLPVARRPAEPDFEWSDWRAPAHLYRDGTWFEGDAIPDFRMRTRVRVGEK